MPIIQLLRATNPPTPEAVHINSGAVLFVEATTEHQVGQTLIQVFGQTEQGIRVVESIQHVLEALPGSFGAYRHYHAGAPPEGESVVHIYEHNIASITPNTPHDTVFWTITFKDQFALRVMAPLPLGL
ncbi:MAG: hypothetical protein V4627_18770 [Pseudomonadota bacterium]